MSRRRKTKTFFITSHMYGTVASERMSDLELPAGHFDLPVVFLLLQLGDTLVISGNDARESGYNINKR